MALVSIIVPNYNHYPYLLKRLESIEKQTYKDVEVILLDDASTDGSAALLASFAERHTHWRFEPSRVNSGSPFAQWNKGLALARGQYIWIAESDDFAEPTLLEKLVPLLDNNPQVGIAYGQSYLVNERDEVLNSYEENLRFIYKSDDWQRPFTENGKEANRKWLLFHNPIPNASGIVLRKEAYRAAGKADETMRLNGDWLHYAKILNQYDLAFTPEHLNYFRVHQKSQREKARANGKVYREIIKINEFISRMDSQADINARAALGKVGDWWIGSLPYQKHSLENQKVNRELFHFFKAHKPHLRYRIFLTYVISYLRDFLIFLGMLKPLKNMRAALFPHKYFKH